MDVNPQIPDAEWLRRWSIRQTSQAAINPPFPEGIFSLNEIERSKIRCLYTIADLDDFARVAPNDSFQGYLSMIVMEIKLLEHWTRRMLLSGECCQLAIYANSLVGTCRKCGQAINLRLSPGILGQVIDETGAIAAGKLLMSDRAWRDLLGRGTEELLQMSREQIKYLADRLLFCRLTFVFGWTGDQRCAGGRICVLRVQS